MKMQFNPGQSDIDSGQSTERRSINEIAAQLWTPEEYSTIMPRTPCRFGMSDDVANRLSDRETNDLFDRELGCDIFSNSSAQNSGLRQTDFVDGQKDLGEAADLMTLASTDINNGDVDRGRTEIIEAIREMTDGSADINRGLFRDNRAAADPLAGYEIHNGIQDVSESRNHLLEALMDLESGNTQGAVRALEQAQEALGDGRPSIDSGVNWLEQDKQDRDYVSNPFAPPGSCSNHLDRVGTYNPDGIIRLDPREWQGADRLLPVAMPFENYGTPWGGPEVPWFRDGNPNFPWSDWSNPWLPAGNPSIPNHPSRPAPARPNNGQRPNPAEIIAARGTVAPFVLPTIAAGSVIRGASRTTNGILDSIDNLGGDSIIGRAAIAPITLPTRIASNVAGAAGDAAVSTARNVTNTVEDVFDSVGDFFGF